MTARRTVLITGASGFVGTRLGAALRAARWHVTGIDRLPASDRQAFDMFAVCDVQSDAALDHVRSEQRFDVIVHLAAVLPGRAPRAELFAINAGGTSAVLDRLATPGAHVVLLSSGLVYGGQPGPFKEDAPCMPRDAYAQSKLAAEAIALGWGRATSSPVAVLRPAVVYGSGAPSNMLLVSLMTALRRGEPFATTAGEQLRDFVHIDDAVRAVQRVIEQRAGGVWNLASGESVRVRDAAELTARIAGRPDLLRLGELAYRDNELFDYRLDPSKLRAELDWAPRVELAAGLRQLWEATP